jgi:hypothetical protein
MTRVLRPGGHLVLTTPFAEKLHESTVACPHCLETFHRWGHQQSFRENDFARLAIENALEPVELLPVRYSRYRRLRFLGARILKSTWLRPLMQRTRGQQNLLMVARKPIVMRAALRGAK